MSHRKRMTWADEARRASAHPATPDEGPASPAHQPEPSADKYENGDTSSWAEDPTTGPYPNSAHPATPDEGPASPAYKAAALERKASKCIRIATSMLGEHEGDPQKVAAIEDQALVLMDLPDSAIKASLARLGMDEDEEEEDEEEGSKKASARIASEVDSLRTRVARLERVLIRLAEEEDEEEEEVEVEEAKKKAGDESEEDESEDEEAKKKAGWDMSEEAMLDQMLAEEGMDESMDESPMDDVVMDEEVMMDPMGMAGMDMDDEETMILASLFKDAGDDEDEDEEEDEEEEVEVEEAKKKAAATPRPQPKKASDGARKLGGPVSKEAGSDVDDLSKIWESAPDVSRYFN